MYDIFARERLVIGEEALKKLGSAKVVVFGIGGVGSFAAEALARGGIGELMLVDGDVVDATNINRQLIALTSTVGRGKADVMAERIALINPEARVTPAKLYVDAGTDVDISGFDYAVDAVDSVTAKLKIIAAAKAAGVPVISAMGAGNKLDPTLFRVADIEKTSVCPLSRVMRRELKKRGITGVKAVYSTEEPRGHAVETAVDGGKRQVPGSVSFVPPVMGMIIAGEVIRDIAGI